MGGGPDAAPHKEGWLYLAAVLDVFDKRVVGWSMGERAQAELVVGAVEMAVRNRRPEPGLVHHSDRGSQYGSCSSGGAWRVRASWAAWAGGATLTTTA